MVKDSIRTLMFLLGCAGLMSLQAQSASAHTVLYNTSATIHFHDLEGGSDPPDWFGGQVNSGVLTCRQQRQVKLYHGVPPAGVLVGGAMSNNSGAWIRHFEDPTQTTSDPFYVKVTPQTLLSNGNHHHTCKPFTSFTIDPLPDN